MNQSNVPPPPPGTYHYYYRQPAVEVPLNGLALTSMILGIAGFVINIIPGGYGMILSIPGWITGVVLAHVSLKQIREKGQRGKRFAIAGLAINWTFVGIVALVAVLAVIRPF